MPPTDADRAHAFQQRLDAHRGIVLKVAASYAQGAEDRADLAQEIALALWRAFPSFDPARPFATWAYRVALNVAISQQRRARPHAAHEPLGEGHEGLVGDGDVDAEAREHRVLVARAMQALGPIDRALLVLHLDGLAHREIAGVLGTSEGNVAVRLTRIRQQLRRVAGAHPEGE